MDVEIVTKPAFTVLGMVERGKNGPKFIPPLWERYMKRFDEIKNKRKSNVGYGVMDNYDKAIEEFDYLAGIEVEPGTEAPEGFTIWDIPNQTYAVIACTIPTIGEVYQFFYQEWLPKEGYQRADGPEFEFYPENFENKETDTIYLYLPIKK